MPPKKEVQQNYEKELINYVNGRSTWSGTMPRTTKFYCSVIATGFLYLGELVKKIKE